MILFPVWGHINLARTTDLNVATVSCLHERDPLCQPSPGRAQVRHDVSESLIPLPSKRSPVSSSFPQSTQQYAYALKVK